MTAYSTRTEIERVLEPCLSEDREDWPTPLQNLYPRFKRYREHQIEAVVNILWEYENGAEIVVLDAPWGSGKTLIAETVRRMIGQKGLYICHTKTLQEQVARDFDCKVLMGRSNYPTMREDLWHEVGRWRITAADCTKRRMADDPEEEPHCNWCEPWTECPYEQAKRALLRSELGVVNTSYFLTECNFVGRLAGRDFVIADECDTLESELMGFIGIDISSRRINEFGLGEPARVTKSDAWLAWCESADSAIASQLGREEQSESHEDEVGYYRRKNYLTDLRASIRRVFRGIEQGNWIFTGRDGGVSFKPIDVRQLGEEYLWRHGRRWLLMSATVISAQELMESLGGDSRNWAEVRLGSVYEKKNRPIRIVNGWDGSRKARSDREFGRLGGVLASIITRHQGDNVLVHTVSYDVASYLKRSLAEHERTVITYGTAAERDRALSEFVGEDGQPSGGSDSGQRILIAPSMDRGIDLPGDLCRVVVICKTPFPYLGDRQVAARTYNGYGGQTWYNVQTIRRLVQMSGRGVRSEDDWCVTYIVDHGFQKIWNSGRRFFPQWWREAIEWKVEL